jgi:D-alanine-D-alanine ligase
MENIPKHDTPKQLRVGLTYNLKKHVTSDVADIEAEYDNIETVLAIRDALQDENCKVELLEATEELPNKLSNHAVDIVFNIAEGILEGAAKRRYPQF